MRRARSAKSPRDLDPTGWDRKSLRSILGKMRGKRILIAGDVGVDRYTQGAVERISPEAPVPVVLVQSETLKLGLAANVADNVKALDGSPLLLGVVGADRGAQDLKRLMARTRISPAHLVQDRSRRTVLKERVVTAQQQIVRVDYENSHPLGAEVERAVASRFASLVDGADAVILQDYAKGFFGGALAPTLIGRARKAGIFVAVDPNMESRAANFRGCFVLTPNLREAEKLSGIRIDSEQGLRGAGDAILRETGADYVIITRGKEGMAIFEAGTREMTLMPTFAREVFDVSGAGDTVISVLTLAIAAGASVIDAAVLGNLAAGVEVGKRGTATVTQREILEFMERV